MIQRYGFYLGSDDMEPEDDGQFVKHSDHETAIAEARKQERERCIAEISGIVRDFMGTGHAEASVVGGIMVRHLKKGLTQ